MQQRTFSRVSTIFTFDTVYLINLQTCLQLETFDVALLLSTTAQPCKQLPISHTFLFRIGLSSIYGFDCLTAQCTVRLLSLCPFNNEMVTRWSFRVCWRQTEAAVITYIVDVPHRTIGKLKCLEPVTRYFSTNGPTYPTM